MATQDLSAGKTANAPTVTGLLRGFTWLFEPHASLTDEVERRRSQLLAGMMGVTFATGVIGLGWTFWRGVVVMGQIDTILILIGIALVGVAMVINRLGNVQWAARLFIGIMAPIFAAMPFINGANDDLSFFIIAPILVTGIFFSARTTGLLIVIIAVATTLASLLLDLNSPLMPTFYLAIAGGTLYLFITHLQFQERVRTMHLREMNNLLRASEESLERRVQARTRDLQLAADVSLQITTELNPSQLLADVVERTAEAFGLLHVAVFLYDADERVLRLKQGYAEAGRRMVEAGKQFYLDDVGLVPRAANSRAYALANDVTNEPDYFANPLLPETRAELAVPMLYRGQLVGVLDVQADTVDRFRDEDTRIMRTLADQIAVAVRNSQFFEETQTARQRAEQADHVKSAFLASMSHELRTPLNAIINFSKFLKKGVPGPVNEEQEELIGSIAESGQHLLNLINDVLDMSKIEAGSLKLYVEEDIDMRQILETAVQYTAPLLADKPVELVLDLPATLPVMTGDRKRLLQIFLNILSNACKFTENGQVTVRAEVEAAALCVSVHDTGPGIPMEDAEHIFTAFKQTQQGLRQGGGGTGLGMPICQKLVEAHAGRVWFDSQPGAGTTFYVELPL